MGKKQLIFVGGAAHCKVVISILKNLEHFELTGIVDNYWSYPFIVDRERIQDGQSRINAETYTEKY